MTEGESPSSWKGSLVVFAVALGLRLLYVAEMHPSPLWSVPFGIAAYDHTRALAILGGDESGGVFYHAALYAYFLAGVYSVFGPGALAVRLLQAVIGSLTCVLLARLGTRFFSPRVGLFAGLLLAVYPPAILLDGVLQKATLALFLLVLLLLVLGRAREDPRPHLFLGAGVLLGLLSTGRENAILLVPVLLPWIWFASSAAGRSARVAGVLVFVVGAGLPMLAAGVRNYAVAGDFVPGASNAGASLYIGNRTGASGLFEGLVAGRGIAVFDPVDARRLAEAEKGEPLRASEVNRYWLKRTLDEVVAEPLAWGGLLARKAFYLVNAREWAGAYDLQAFRRHSVVLRILGVPFRWGVVVALGLVGMALAWPTRGRTGLLFWVAGALALSIVLTFVDPRFRLSLVPVLLLFGAQALVRGGELFREGRTRQVAGLAGAVLFALVIVHLPTGVEDWSESSTYNKLGLALAQEERHQEALDMYLRALEAEPGNPSAHFNAGAALLRQGEVERGVAHLEEAALLEPAFQASVALELGIFRGEQGELAQAVEFLVRARDLAPLDPDVHFNLGLALRLLERWDEAEEAYREALRLDPGHADARRNLAFMLGGLGWVLATDAERRDGPRALRYAEQALELEASPSVRATLAAAHAACGDFDDALRIAEELERELRAAGEEAMADQARGYAEAFRAGQVWSEGG